MTCCHADTTYYTDCNDAVQPCRVTPNSHAGHTDHTHLDVQPLDLHRPLLPHAPCPAHCLVLQCRVEARLHEEHHVGSSQVDAHSARAHRQEEDGGRGVVLEGLNGAGALGEGHGAADVAVAKALGSQPGLEPFQGVTVCVMGVGLG